MNPLIKKFGAEARWVTWKKQERKGKVTKIPYTLSGDMASSTNADDWSTYDEVKNFSDNVGIIFTPEKKLLGIDIDHCLKNKKIDHEKRAEIKELIEKADTYTEISPSGEGLHLFLYLDRPLELKGNKKAPFELYTSGRYFTVTANSLHKSPKDIRLVSIAEAEEILTIIGYPWKEAATEKIEQSGQINIPNEKVADSTLVEKMFASKNGHKIRSLWDGTSDIEDTSAADLSLCSYLAFWTAKDPVQMEQLWLSSPLGSRKKTVNRKDYRDRTIAAAIASCKDVYETPSTAVEKVNKEFDLDLLFVLNEKKDKVYILNTENMCRILRHHPHFKGCFRYDIFRNAYEIKIDAWRHFEDNDAVTIQTQVQILFSYFGRVGKEMIYDAMVKVAKENTVDCARDYMTGLVWDGTARLDTWMTKAFGVIEDEYHRAVGSNFLKGIVKRVIEPGCKFDYVLVLEGPQGSKKSTSLSILGNGWHVETTMSTESKDFFMQLAGQMIVEFSEGETLSRTEVKRMKAIITTQVDKFRPAYGRAVVEFPRRCVFAMTTNDEEYLKDETGNRRWLPVRLVFEEADVVWLQNNYGQLYAEAYYRLYTLKESVHEFPKQALLDSQNARRVHYEHEDAIVDWYYEKLSEVARSEGVTIHQVYRDALNGGFVSKMHNKFDEMKIAGVLKDILKLKRKRIKNKKIRAWRWYDESIEITEDQEVVLTNRDEEF